MGNSSSKGIAVRLSRFRGEIFIIYTGIDPSHHSARMPPADAYNYSTFNISSFQLTQTWNNFQRCTLLLTTTYCIIVSNSTCNKGVLSLLI